MKVIAPMIGSVERLLGKQKPVAEGTPCRLLHFCERQPVPEGLLLYNSLTKELLLLDEGETRNLEAFERGEVPANTYLFEHFFIVPAEMEEWKLSDSLRELIREVSRPKGIMNYNIFTTTDCNARCFYCFEQGARRYSMTEQTAKDVARYIYECCGGSRVKISWFGGEPLMNMPAIDCICTCLQEYGVEYGSIITTNGYLFDDAVVEKAEKLWHLKSIGITLDGTEEIYNRCKSFIYENGSAFRRVMGNIERLLKAGLKVRVRLNMDWHNAANLYQLCDELQRRFGSYPGFGVQSALLYERGGAVPLNRSEEKRRRLYQEYEALVQYMDKLGILLKTQLKRRVKTNSCQADSDSMLNILPDGRLGKCEHFLGDRLVGSIYEETPDAEEIEKWKAYNEHSVKCHICSQYPDCILLKGCPVKAEVCNQEEQEQRIRNKRRAMADTYREIVKENASKRLSYR